jgi:hypothetical protein
MGILAPKTDERVEAVYFTRDSLVVDLMGAPFPLR